MKTKRSKYAVKRKAIRIHHAALLRDDPVQWGILLGVLGFSFKVIEENTGLTYSQISYWHRKFGVSVKDYRNGANKYGNAMIVMSAKVPMESPVAIDVSTKLALPW